MKKMVVSSGLLSSRVINLARIISSKNTLTALDSLVFTVKDGICNIMAADMESQVSTNIPLDEADDISFGLDARMLLNSLKELAEQPLTFNLNEKTRECVINYHNGKFCIPMTNISDFPAVLVLDTQGQNTVEPDMFRTIVNKCTPYVANDELRPVMNGIHFDFKDTLVCAASDGHALIKISVKDSKIEQEGNFILSYKSAKLCESYVGRQTTDVAVTFNGKQAKFMFEDYTFITRLIEGHYPNYNSVIPTNYTDSVLVNCKELLSTIKRVSVFASSYSGLLEFNLTGMQLELQGRDIDYSTSSMETLMVTKNGNDIRAGLKAVYMSKICSTFDNENINIYYRDACRAFVYKPETEDEKYDMLLLQMPMMLND